MPDAAGKFKGISVPELPWQKPALAIQPRTTSVQTDPVLKGKFVCVNPNCIVCNATQELERPRS